jgi:uncharacterized coiled-coil protein SlyX
MTDQAARLVDLELRFMALERFTHELSDVVAEQGRTIEALVAETKRLRGLAPESDRDETVREKPPHY